MDVHIHTRAGLDIEVADGSKSLAVMSRMDTPLIGNVQAAGEADGLG